MACIRVISWWYLKKDNAGLERVILLDKVTLGSTIG